MAKQDRKQNKKNFTQKTKDYATQTRDELMCSGRVEYHCSISDTVLSGCC